MSTKNKSKKSNNSSKKNSSVQLLDKKTEVQNTNNTKSSLQNGNSTSSTETINAPTNKTDKTTIDLKTASNPKNSNVKKTNTKNSNANSIPKGSNNPKIKSEVNQKKSNNINGKKNNSKPAQKEKNPKNVTKSVEKKQEASKNIVEKAEKIGNEFIEKEDNKKGNNKKETTKKETEKNVIKQNPKQDTNPVVLDNKKNITSTEKEKKSSNVMSVFVILLVILFLTIVCVFFIFSVVASNSDEIFSGIYIKNIDVSTLKRDFAKTKLEEYIKSQIPEEIILTHNDAEFGISSAELKIDFDVNDAVNTAYNIGRSNNLILNGFDIISTGISNKNVEPVFKIDEEYLEKSLNDMSSKLPDKLIESGYYIEGNNLILNKGATGNAVDVKKTKKIVFDKIKNLNLIDNKIELSVKTANPSKLDMDSIYKEVKKDATDAKFTAEPLSVTPSENGVDFAISIDEAKSKLENSEEQECVIPLKVVYPNVTTNMIGTEAFPDKLSEFSTHYAASNVNRTTNLRLAANKINGTVLMPGEVFSYNQVVGERSIAAGYKEAPIYVSGRVEDGLGGGICQITTTLYNAVAFANLEIVERTNHQFVPSYVGAGRDATVVYGAIDFKFKNNRDYPIKLICSVSGGIANFQILGLRTDNDYDVEIYARVTGQSAGYTNSETYRILKQNGQVVKQELLSRDTYKRH